MVWCCLMGQTWDPGKVITPPGRAVTISLSSAALGKNIHWCPFQAVLIGPWGVQRWPVSAACRSSGQSEHCIALNHTAQLSCFSKGFFQILAQDRRTCTGLGKYQMLNQTCCQGTFLSYVVDSTIDKTRLMLQVSHVEKLLVQFYMHIATEQTLWSNYNLTYSNTYQLRKCQDVYRSMHSYFFSWSNTVQNAIRHRPDSGLCIYDNQRLAGTE